MKKITINSISEFIENVCECNSSSELRREDLTQNEILLYRGHADEHYELIPSIGRDGLITQERNLIELVKYKMPNIFKNNMYPLELLALLQHYGIPTRLLDVTENPLVALYFACCSRPETNGEIFVFKNNDAVIATYSIVNAIADSYRLLHPQPIRTSLENFYNSAIEQHYFSEDRYICKYTHKTKEQKEEWIQECCEKIHFVYAPVRTLRQQMQQGRYILFPNEIDSKKNFIAKMTPMSKNDKCIFKVFQIPADRKRKILIDLKCLGISEEVLFCDNIDKMCNEIKKHYQEIIKNHTYNPCI